MRMRPAQPAAGRRSPTIITARTVATPGGPRSQRVQQAGCDLAGMHEPDGVALQARAGHRAFEQERQMLRQGAGLIGTPGQQAVQVAGEQPIDLLLVRAPPPARDRPRAVRPPR